MKNKDKELQGLEIEYLLASARNSGNNGHRNATMILIMYRYGLSIKEIVDLRWEEVDIKLGLIYSKNIAKKELDFIYPLFGHELKILKKMRQQNPNSVHVFTSGHQNPLTVQAFRKIIKRALMKADIPICPNELSAHRKKYLGVGDGYTY